LIVSLRFIKKYPTFTFIKPTKQMQKNIQIFIVDDDPFWSGVLKLILTRLEYSNISLYSNGTDCINDLNLNPKLIFLDYQLGDMDGIEVLQKIKKYNSETGVVFCTAHEDLNVAIDAMKSGSFDFIIKTDVSDKKIECLIKNMADKQIFFDKVF
jgi:DNA-binding NtrC family response regulator